MTVRRSRLCALVLGGVVILAALNACAPFGAAVADRVELILQVSVGVGAMIVGIITAAGERGLERWWRLSFVLASFTWVLGQTLWHVHVADWAPMLARAIYLALPVLVFTSVILLARSSGGIRAPAASPLRQSLVTNVLDGVIAAIAFLILAAMSDLGTRFEAASPVMRVLDVVFIGAEIGVIGVIVLIAMIYDADRPNRTNYMLLAGGLLLMGVSNRMLAYVRSVDRVDAELWVGIGLIVGPVLTTFAFLPTTPAREADVLRRQDWPHLLLPYMGFLGVAVLFAYHLYIDREVSALAAFLTIVMVVLVASRQVVATRAERSLTQWLFWAQRGLAHQVHHDPLTGLPNRTLFAKRLDEAMARGKFVLIFLDLDDFKEVNDQFGHAAGDELLRAVGERLTRSIGDRDTLARVGGDEFAALIVSNGDADDQLEGAADRLRIALRDPFPVHGSSVRVRASMGLVRPDTEGLSQTSDNLLRQADVAMYAGKRMGKNTAVVYNPLAGAVVDFPTMLREALGAPPPGFRLVYQPVVALPGGELVAVEALARWTAGNGVEISPETFVADAEAAGMGAELDALVLDMACGEARAAGLDLDIHVNIGGARLGTPGFDQVVREVLQRHEIPRGRLILEITETEPIVDLDKAATQITRFGEFGVKVALDDFGSGFNSLLYLHCLPVDIVKLDRTLASDMDAGRDLTLYRSVINLCGELGFEVIAEGIETADQADMVCRAGGRFGQGYLFGRPVPMSELAEMQRRAVRTI